MRMIEEAKLRRMFEIHADSALFAYFSDVWKLLAKVPVVDAEPIVRCKDCHWYQQNPFREDKQKYCRIWEEDLPTDPDDFCSSGERRNANE